MHSSSRHSVFSLWVLFLSLAFFLCILTVLDRAGLPIVFIELATAFLLWFCVCATGFMALTLRPSHFFGRDGRSGFMGNSALYVLFCLIFAASQTATDFNFSPVMAVSGIGAFSAALLFAPKFRRSGAYTLNDFMRGRFQHWLPSLVIFVSSFLCFGLLASACFAIIMENLTNEFGISVEIAIASVGFAATFAAFAGGLSSIVLTALLLCLVLFLTLVSTTGLIYFQQPTLHSFHVFSDMLVTRSDIIGAFGAISGIAGLMYALGFWNTETSQKTEYKKLAKTVGIGLAFLFTIIIGTDFIHHTALKADAVQIFPLILGKLYGLFPVFIGFFGLCLSLFGLSALLGHSIFYQHIRPKSTSSLRLAAIRLTWLSSFLVVSDVSQIISISPVFLLHVSLAVAAGTIAPIILISLFSRAGSLTANLTLAAGTVVTAILIFAIPETPLLAGTAGFFAACFVGTAGLASCPPSEKELDFAQKLHTKNYEPLIINQDM